MKVFKFIFKTLLVLIFIVSIAFNILLFKSSYAPLIFNYNYESYWGLSNSSFDKIKKFFPSAPPYTLKNKGLQYEIEDGSEITASAYYYYDKNGAYTFSLSVRGDEEDKDYYYADGFLYSKIGDTKTKELVTDFNSLSSVSKYILNSSEDYSISDCIFASESLIDEEEHNFSPMIDFSINPFYLVGIKFQAIYDNSDEYTYSYDLRGNLRVIEVRGEDKSKQTTITFNYKDTKVAAPNLEGYTLSE